MKTPLLDGIIKSAAMDFEKQARITLENVEDALEPGYGSYLLAGDRATRAQELIGRETDKRLGVRHPVLTGIPTLGLWPAISKDRALDAIRRQMQREDPELLSAWNQKVQDIRAARIEAEKRQIESDRANAARNAVSAGGLAALGLMAEYNRGRQERQEAERPRPSF